MKRLLAAVLLATTGIAQAGNFTISSASFANGGTIPLAQVFDQHGCAGRNVSPAVAWSGAPAGTRGFAVTLFDSDARAGKGFWHWIVADIPASATHLTAGGALPNGAKPGKTDWGFAHYGGPCPPVGDAPHHYHLTVYALRVTKLPAAALRSHAALAAALAHDSLASASIVGRYGRAKPN
ncbi:YbhB/YbcL family Raf kinase inhibitor-like protein [Acidiphilium iwatense]|uniref:YbhB/YbcL family Raf kinase inhibitor-like protein n=1 Tax=Acidiphilium iwatense TaxID=768198 RepID=A0ABS9DW18_9PROT|nr:YbhB/YbcL family Raf kinase inhibitor-like protein [Acidiphilium iwatense]MCF3946935.1 YbhB/YbcL family Raf kinase inhibitor-like protein [Acidiphilium iwatense]